MATFDDDDKKWLIENFASKKGQIRLEKRMSTLENGQSKLEKGQMKLEKGQSQLEKSQNQLEKRMSTLENGQSKLEKGQVRLEKKLDFVANKLDKDNLATKQRVEKIESHLGISPPEF